MADTPSPHLALVHIAGLLNSLKRDYALVEGLAVSIRAEVRFTRDVDVAVAVDTDADAESRYAYGAVNACAGLGRPSHRLIVLRPPDALGRRRAGSPRAV